MGFKKHKKKRFTLSKFLLDIVLSPIVIIGIGYWYFGGLREGVLLSLYIATGFHILSLIIKVIMLIVSSVTFNLFGMAKRLSQIIVTLLTILLYWGMYMMAWGQNFTL